MTFSYGKIQRKAHKMITKFGIRAALRRNGVDRPCTAVVIEYKPTERALVLEGSRRALVDRIDPVTRAPLAVPPNHESDLLVFAGDVLRLVKPDAGPRPNGTAIYHDLEVQYDSRDV